MPVVRSMIGLSKPRPCMLLVNDSLKLVENQRSEIDGLRGLSGEICERISPSIFWWQTASGGNSLSRPQPPEAVAEGQSLQGIASRRNSATEIDPHGHHHDCDPADNACTCMLGATRIDKKW